MVRRARVLAWKLLRRLPESVLRRVVDWGDSGPQQSIPPLPRFSAAERRVLFAPHNAAAQGWYWARAVSRLPQTAARSLHVDRDNPFATPGDSVVPERVYLWSRRWQRAAERFVSNQVTHVIIESGWRLFGNGLSGRTIDEVRWLQRRGIRVGLLFHGSDIRDPDAHARSHPLSPFAPGVWQGTAALRAVVAENRALIAEAGVPTFVSTLDLLDDLPEATWVPVVVDADLWRSTPPFRHGGPVRVAHVPSSSALKGTDLIEPTLQRLHAEGVIEYVRVRDVPFAEMPRIVNDVDVVLDQFRMGIYGVAACEAMAAGRLVVSNVSDIVRQRVLERTGLELPIVESSAADAEALLRAIAADPAPWAATAAAGVEFVGAVHDGRRSAEALADFLGHEVCEHLSQGGTASITG